MKKIHIIPRMKKEILYILFIAFIGLLIVLFFVPRSMMPGDRGDARFNMVILEHGYQWLIGNNTDFWGSGFFFPSEEKIIAFSDHHIGNLPIYTLFRLASFSRETSLQLLIISSLFLNFFISYIVIKRLGYSFVSSFLGAFLFSFSLPIMAQVNHMQLLPRYFSFLAIFFLYRFWNNPKLLSFIFFLLNIVLQFYQSFYLGVFTSILSVFLLIALIILDKRPLQEILKNLLGSKYSILLKFIFIFLSALLLIPIILPYYRVSQMHGTHEWETVISMLPSIRSYFSASPNSWIWNILANTDISLFWEHYLFIGSIPILLMIFSVVILIRKILVSSLTKFDILASASLLVMLFSIIIFTKFGNNFSLYFFLYKIPGVGAIRAVTRFFLVLLIFNSLVIAHSTEIIFKSLISKIPRKIGLVLVLTFVFFFMSDQGISIQNYNKYQSIDRLHSMEKALKETIDSFDKSEIILAVLKNPDYPFYITQIDAMLIAQDFSIDTINGYSGVFPIDYKMGGFNTREDVLHYAYKNSDFFLNKKIIIYSEESINIERILPHKTITPMNRELVESELLYSCSFVKKKEISDKKFEHFFKLTNNGNGVWNGLPDSDGRKQLSVSYRFLNNEKDPVTDFNPRINLPFDLYPGDSFIFSLIVDQKKFPERNFVEISLVQELTFWFQDKGIVTKIFSIE